MSVIQRPYADGVARSDKLLCLPVINYHGKLRVELFEHLKAVFAVKRQNDLAVGLAFEAVFCTQLLAELSEAVQLAVADYRVAVEAERLHAAFVKSHDRQAVKSEYRAVELQHPRCVRAARYRAVKIRSDRLSSKLFACETDD